MKIVNCCVNTRRNQSAKGVMANRDPIDDARSESSVPDARAPLSEYLRYDRDPIDTESADTLTDGQSRRDVADPIALRHIKETLTANRRLEYVEPRDGHIARLRTARVDYPYYDQTEGNVPNAETLEDENTEVIAMEEQFESDAAQSAQATSIQSPPHPCQEPRCDKALNTDCTSETSDATKRRDVDEPVFEIDLAPNVKSRTETENNYRRLSANRRAKSSMPILSRFVELVGQTQETVRESSDNFDLQTRQTADNHSSPCDPIESTPGVTVAMAIAPEYLASSTMVGVFEDGAL